MLLHREQVLKAFEGLGYPLENIVSTVDVEGFAGAEIFRPEVLSKALQDVMSKAGDKNNRLILFRVGAESRSFVANEAENNHYVALHFAQNGANLNLTYIDPTGDPISPQIMNIIDYADSLLTDYTIKSSHASLQFTNPTPEGVAPYQMRGNDSDCGVLVALSADMVRRNHEGRNQVKLNESSPIQLGQTLRQLVSGEKRIEDVGQVIWRILDEGKVKVGTTSQDSELDEALDNLLLAFALPKTFKEFKDLDEARKVKLYKTGIDGTSARNYKSDFCQKTMLGMVAAILEDRNYDYSDFPSITKNKLLERGIPEGNVKEIGYKMLDFVSDKHRTLRASVRVEHLAKQQGLEIDEIIENPRKGANMSFTAMVNGKKHYIKTCSDDVVLASNGKVDPNELFVYKVMEYMGFGPRTNFLFGKYSSSARRSSISRGNYIMTEDLNQNGNRLLLDTEENHGAFQEALAVDRQFAVEISAASALNDILSLSDTFGRNVRNYGLLIRSDGSRMIQFVDHLPNANNGLFSLMDFDPTTYSPRDYLQRKSSLGLKSDEHSAFKDLEGNRSSFQRMIIQRDVNSRLSGLEEAIKQAELDVRSLMRPETFGENFIEEAGARMTRYMEKIGRNKATYERTIPQATQEGR